VLILMAAVLTVWSMVYYLQKALPEIRAKASAPAWRHWWSACSRC
jgi:hypothetical protein